MGKFCRGFLAFLMLLALAFAAFVTGGCKVQPGATTSLVPLEVIVSTDTLVVYRYEDGGRYYYVAQGYSTSRPTTICQGDFVKEADDGGR